MSSKKPFRPTLIITEPLPTLHSRNVFFSVLFPRSPDVKEEFVELMSAGGPGAEKSDDGDEPEAPEPFEWSDDMLD